MKRSAKLTDEMVSEIRRLRADGYKNIDIAKIYSVNTSTISRITAMKRRTRPMEAPTVTDMPVSEMARLYAGGMSTPEIADLAGCSYACIRNHLIKSGVVLRSPKEYMAIAGPKNGEKRRGVPRGPMSEDQRRRHSEAMRARMSGRGYRKDSRGYFTFTRGAVCGRLVHVVLMELVIGRPLKDGEVVHHRDGSRDNNALENLQLMTREEHSRIHRLMEPNRGRDRNGRFM